jgi:hypothetical protein
VIACTRFLRSDGRVLVIDFWPIRNNTTEGWEAYFIERHFVCRQNHMVWIETFEIREKHVRDCENTRHFAPRTVCTPCAAPPNHQFFGSDSTKIRKIALCFSNFSRFNFGYANVRLQYVVAEFGGLQTRTKLGFKTCNKFMSTHPCLSTYCTSL